MMNKNIMLLICAIVSISGYSQEKASVTQNPTTESRDSITTFLEQKNYRWDHLIVIPDYKKENYDPGIQVYPTTFLIDKKGIVQDVFWGGRLRQIIASLEVLDGKKAIVK